MTDQICLILRARKRKGKKKKKEGGNDIQKKPKDSIAKKTKRRGGARGRRATIIDGRKMKRWGNFQNRKRRTKREK